MENEKYMPAGLVSKRVDKKELKCTSKMIYLRHQSNQGYK